MKLKDLILNTQVLWKAKKNEVESMYRRLGRNGIADRYHYCAMFSGNESMNELSDLMFSPQGIEFMVENRFPSLNIFLEFKKFDMESHGIFINSGKIEISGKDNIFLVGETDAQIYCDELRSYKIVLMHGAKARIKANGYAVVKIDKDNVSVVECDATDYAKVLS